MTASERPSTDERARITKKAQKERIPKKMWPDSRGDRGGGQPWRGNHQRGFRGGENFNSRGGSRGGRRGNRSGRGRGFVDRGRPPYRGGGRHNARSNQVRYPGADTKAQGQEPTDYRSFVTPAMTQNPWAALEEQYGVSSSSMPPTCSSEEASSSS